MPDRHGDPEKSGRPERKRRDDSGPRGRGQGRREEGRRDREESRRHRASSSDRRPGPRRPRPAPRTSAKDDRWSQLSDDQVREQMRDLILGASLMETGFGARRFYFVSRDKRVSFLDISDDLSSRLVNGQAGLVEVPGDEKGRYTVVPRDLADRIRAVDPEQVRFLNTEPDSRFQV